jgi:hypothetical protein
VVAPLRLDVVPYIDENSDVAKDATDVAYVLRSQILHEGAESKGGNSSFFSTSYAAHSMYLD